MCDVPHTVPGSSVAGWCGIISSPAGVLVWMADASGDLLTFLSRRVCGLFFFLNWKKKKFKEKKIVALLPVLFEHHTSPSGRWPVKTKLLKWMKANIFVSVSFVNKMNTSPTGGTWWYLFKSPPGGTSPIVLKMCSGHVTNWSVRLLVTWCPLRQWPFSIGWTHLKPSKFTVDKIK